MAARKQFQTSLSASPELQQLLAAARETEVTQSELLEQRVSFAFGNALNSDAITKESVRRSSERISLR